MKRFCLEEMALQCVCVLKGVCESMGALSMTWPGLVLVSLLLSNHSGDHRPGTCKHLETQPGYEDREKGVRVE